MRRAAWATCVAAAAALGAARAQEPPSVMDRCAALFTPGRPIGFQLLFETLDTTHDLDFNTTVAEARERAEGEARLLLVTTATFEHQGVQHRFLFVLRDGALSQLDLLRASKTAAGGWERVPRDTFWFQVIDDPPPPDFLETGDVVLMARGGCNEGRGGTERARATLALRSFHAETGKKLAY